MTETSTTRRRLSQIALIAEAALRAGTSDPEQFAFRCPRCGHVQTAADLPPHRQTHVAQACFACGLLAELADERIAAELWLVDIDEDGEPTACFPLADALDTEAASGPHSPVRVIASTGGPERAETPSAPLSAPPQALRVERQQPQPQTIPDGAEQLDMENWDYRVALTDDQAILGRRHKSGLTVLFADTAAWQLDAFHDLADGSYPVEAHIRRYDLPFGIGRVADASLLVRSAHARDMAAQASTQLIPVQVNDAPGCYWTAEQGWLEKASDLAIGCSCHLSAPCSSCESLTACPHCPTEVFVPGADMDAHLAAIHPEIAESEA